MPPNPFSNRLHPYQPTDSSDTFGEASFNVTRPSTDQPLPDPFREADPNRLSANLSPPPDNESTEKRRREVERLRREANVESAIEDQLRKYGIPFRDDRLKISASKTVSASNVNQEILTQLRWEFYESYENFGFRQPLAWSALEKAQAVWEGVLYHGLGPITSEPLKLPSDWIEHTDNDLKSITFRCLTLHLKLLRSKLVKFCPRQEVVKLQYPAPNVTLNESENFPEDRALGVEWGMLKILGFSCLSLCRSELEVERHIGSCLTSFFHIKDCITSSNTEVKFPTAIGCFGSFAKPDFAARLQSEKIDEHLRPLVVLGEAKREFEGPSSSSEAHMHRVAAQLAWSAQPTLTMMIMATVSAYLGRLTQWKTSKGSKEKPEFLFPDSAFIYGIAYDAFGVVIYSFFPRIIRTNSDGLPVQCGFGCATVDVQYKSVFKDNNPNQRLRLIQALLTVQTHATKLANQFKDLWIPPELKLCHRLYDQRKLWSN